MSTHSEEVQYRNTGREQRKREYEEAVRLHGPLDPPHVPHEEWPAYGIHRQVYKDNKEAALDTLRLLRQHAAIGDISAVQDHVLEVTWAFNVDIDPHSAAYLKLGNACLHSYIRALEDISKRDEGVTVETPAPVALPGAPLTAAGAADGGTLQEALEGWKKHRSRPKGTVNETSRAVTMFTELHGNMVVAAIKKKHALEYRASMSSTAITA